MWCMCEGQLEFGPCQVPTGTSGAVTQMDLPHTVRMRAGSFPDELRVTAPRAKSLTHIVRSLVRSARTIALEF